MKVILLEFIDEAELILNKYGKDFLSENAVIISFHPKVRAFLKEKGVDSESTIDYLDNDSQHRIILESDRLTVLISERINLSDKFGISKGYKETFIHHMRFYLNHFFWIIEILNNVEKKHEIEVICCCLPERSSELYTKKAYLQDQERFLGLLAEDFCKVYNIPFQGIPKKALKPRFFLRLSTAIVRKIGEVIGILDYKSLIANKKDSRKTIVVPALSYRMDKLITELKQKIPDIRCFVVWEGRGTLRQQIFKIYLVLSNYIKKVKGKNIAEGFIFLELIRDIFKKDAQQQNSIKKEFRKLNTELSLELKDELVCSKVSFLPYLLGKINNGLGKEMLSLQHTTAVLEKVLRSLKPDLLMSMYSMGVTYMMGELSRRMGFESLDITHGTHVPPNNEFEKIENYRLATGVILNTYKKVAVQTPWADKFLDYYKDARPRLLSGPLIYSIVNNDTYGKKIKAAYGIPHNMKVITHATTQKSRNGLRFHIAETLDEYISALSSIVEAVNKLEDVFLIIKPHPACNISQKEFMALLPHSDKFVIIHKEPFAKVLSIADLLISYSSTCVEEALQNRIPVILFDKWGRYNHFNIKETKAADSIGDSPVYYISAPGILSKSISKILNSSKNGLFEGSLSAYKYPEEYKSNFFDFVEKTLKR